MKLPIYMDCHATTPVDPRVLEAMLPYFTTEFGNAASKSHAFGWRAEEAVEEAREQVARLVGATAREIVWTSGATESDNLALKGVARFHRARGRHLVTCRTEHKAVLDSARALERDGFEVTFLEVEPDGRLDPARVRAALRPDTVLVSPRSLVEGRPEVVIGVIRTMLRAQRIIEDDPRVALATVAHRFPGFSLDELEAGLARQPSQVDLRGLEPTILGRWPTIRKLQGKPSSTPPAGLIDFRRLEAALAAEALVPSDSPSGERMMNHV